jgi:hypothetical protein
MLSHCARYVIAFNGEVYNFAAIRDELEQAGGAPAWRGHSDTEVMLEAVAAWGLEAALNKFVGMFAFACGTVTHARSRLPAIVWVRSRFITAGRVKPSCSARNSRHLKPTRRSAPKSIVTR